MKVDRYRSLSRPEFSLVVATGTDLTMLNDEYLKVVESMAPLGLEDHDIELETIILGSEMQKIIQEIETAGAGIMKYLEPANEMDIFEGAIE